MKTILVPTDYSAASANAVEYASTLARLIEARIILYHTYHITLSSVDYFSGMMPPFPDISQIEQSSLEEYAQRFRTDSGELVISKCLTSPGFAADEIPDYAGIVNADMVVMGISGPGKTGHPLFGSITTSVIEKTKRALLLVPEKVKFETPKRIAYACDLEQNICTEVVERVKAFARLFNAELFVINVEQPGQEISDQKAFVSRQLVSELQGVTHSLHFPSHQDVVTGLVSFEDRYGLDMLVMVARKHTLFQQLFHASKTRKMIGNTHVPILVLHGGVC